MYDLAHVARWEPYNPHDLPRAGFLGWICVTYTAPAQYLITAGKDLEDLEDLDDVDRHLPDVCIVFFIA